MAERARNHLAFVSQLKDIPDLEMLDAAKVVAAMMDSKAWKFVVQLLEGRKSQLLVELLDCSVVRPKAEYARRLAQVSEIDVVLDAAPTVLHVAELVARKLQESEGRS